MLTTSPSLQITPINHPLNATVCVPGSKSLTNRALLIAALANGTTRLTNTLFSDDSRYFAKALQTLGFDVQLDEANHEMTVTGLGGKIPSKKAELFIGNAGTAARFLSAFLTLGNGEYILDGEPRMRERPIGDLIAALHQLGVEISPLSPWERDGVRQLCPPVEIFAKGLPGGKTKIAGNISSQFLSALLMVAPYAQAPIEIELTTDLNSKPFVDMTIAIMKEFGVEIERHHYERFIIQPSFFFPLSFYPIESDASAASYFFAAPAICGGTVKVENISRKSVQGDIGFLNVLTKMGCVVTETDNCILVTGSAELHGIDMDMRDIPDTAQTLAAVAPFANSPTRIRGIASARVKETDRVSATCTELKRLGVQVEEHADGMTIYPCQTFTAATIQTYNDHRMAMAFSLIGLRVDGVAIENPACVSKTFPNYFDVLETLRVPSPREASPMGQAGESSGEGKSMTFIRLGLIGFPVSHSLSPKIQNAALKACGLEGDYSLFPIVPEDIQALKALLDRVRSGEITGLNLTIPHKQNVIPFMDELTPTAKAIGAVNIIYMRENKLIGDNTDAPGFLSDLKRFLAESQSEIVNHKSAIVLGAGGSARSVVYALCNDGWNVTISARRLGQAQQLASQFEGANAIELNSQTFQPFDKLRATPSDFQLIVNTTPLGMTPNIDQSPLPENASLSNNTKIYDLVYNPRETKLVRDARSQGLQATTGLGMLIEQAALGFELWTGIKPPKEALYVSVVE